MKAHTKTPQPDVSMKEYGSHTPAVMFIVYGTLFAIWLLVQLV